MARPRIRSRAGRSGRVSTLLALVALMLTLLGAGAGLVVPPNPAVAGETKGEPQLGEPPVVTEEPQPGEPPMVATEEPTKEGAPPETGKEPEVTEAPAPDPGLPEGTWTVVEETPAGGNPGLRIVKANCPEGTRDWSPLALAGSCLWPVSPTTPSITFTLTDAGGSYEATTDAVGEVFWASVPPGPIAVTETIPAGYGEPRAFCNDGSGDREVPVTGGVLRDAMPEGGVMICLWLNFPDDGPQRQVTVDKWRCPFGVNTEGSLAEFRAACTTSHDGVEFELTDDNPANAGARPTSSGQVGWSDVIVPPTGTLEIAETLPAGFEKPAVFCGEGELVPQRLSDGSSGPLLTVTGIANPERFQYRCEWFNIPINAGMVVVHKATCPEGTAYDREPAWYEANCTPGGDGIDFTLTSRDGTSTRTMSGGHLRWDAVPAGAIGIQEAIPAEFGEPVVFCMYSGGATTRYSAPSGYVSFERFGAPRTDSGAILSGDAPSFTCSWYNVPAGSATLTIAMFTCPAGYDVRAATADAPRDCTIGTDGVTFTLADTDAATADRSATTGDAIPHAVRFDGLDPDTYTVFETVPPDTAVAFTWDCTGHRTGELRPTPLNIGTTLDITIRAGEAIACRWYNVPVDDGGRLTVIKYACSTATYVSEVDCEIYEHGQEFDLLGWNGTAWTTIDTGTTDGAGRIGWTGLDAGEYRLDESGRAWCHLASDRLLAGSPSIEVVAGEESVVRVYNCGIPTTTTIPTSYPNTGVPPAPEGTPIPGIAAVPLPLLASRRLRRAIVALVACAMLLGPAVVSGQDTTDVPKEATVGVTIDPAPPGPGTKEPEGKPTEIPATGVPDKPEPTAIPATGGLAVRAQDCPAGTDRSLDLLALDAACPDTDGLTFTATHGGGSSAQVTGWLGFPGLVEWTGVPDGPWSIQGAIPAGYDAPKVYCSVSGAPVIPEVTAPGGRVDGVLTGGVIVYCHWFNFVAGGDNQLTIYNHACPAGTDRTLGFRALIDRCGAMRDVEFTLVASGTTSSQVSAANGGVVWYGIATGTWSVRETVPAGFGEPVVFCYPPGGPAGSPVPVTGGRVDGEFTGTGEIGICAWFNIKTG